LQTEWIFNHNRRRRSGLVSMGYDDDRHHQRGAALEYDDGCVHQDSWSFVVQSGCY
jgi:hypothetical protein